MSKIGIIFFLLLLRVRAKEIGAILYVLVFLLLTFIGFGLVFGGLGGLEAYPESLGSSGI